MLTKTEIRLIDRYFMIHERNFSKAIFYNSLGQIVPVDRAQELYECDAYEEYLESLLDETKYTS
jgi:hypothetical protein